jgi:hypothetical protein
MSGEYTLALQDINAKLTEIKKHVAEDTRTLLERLELTEKALDWAVNKWIRSDSKTIDECSAELTHILMESRDRVLTKGVENDKGCEDKKAD